MEPSDPKPHLHTLCFPTIPPLMASTAPPTFLPILPTARSKPRILRRIPVMSSDSSGEPASDRKPFVDTRIHWSSPEEGWVGGKKRPEADQEANEKNKEFLGARFADFIVNSSTTHYQFLGVSPESDMEEIRAAYRKLSKEYHPDTTSLPLKTASEKFIRLREAYNVLSDDEGRRFYDWTLAQEAEGRRAARMRMELEDPYEQEVRSYVPQPDTVDRLGGKNMKLSDQAMTALTFDIFIIFLSICSIIYVVVFKEQY